MFDILSLLGNTGSGSTAMVFVPVLLAIGLLALLCGYQLFRLFIFMAGFAVGTVVIGLFAEVPVAILGGLIVGALCCALWYLGVFVLGAVLGFLIAMALGIRERFVIIAFACIFGMIAIAIRKFMIIVSTAWFGANLITSAISKLLGLNDMFLRVGISIVIMIFGVICQYSRKSGRKKTPEQAPSTDTTDNEQRKSDGMLSNGGVKSLEANENS